MMQRTVHLTLAAAVAALALTACGEKPQTGMGIRSDAPPYAALAATSRSLAGKPVTNPAGKRS